MIENAKHKINLVINLLAKCAFDFSGAVDETRTRDLRRDRAAF